MLGDLNRLIGDRVKAGITSAFRVPGENDKGRRVMEFCAERGLCVGKTYFKHRSLYKYTKSGKGARRSEGKHHGAGKEGYAVICGECEGCQRNGTRPLRSPCCTV